MYFVTKIWDFLTTSPIPFVITYSTERNQEFKFSDPVNSKDTKISFVPVLFSHKFGVILNP